MASYHNIESRKAPGKAHYVGYASGWVYHVRRMDSRNWIAIPQGMARVSAKGTLYSAPMRFAPTLAAMSARLQEVANALEGKHSPVVIEGL